MDKTAFELHKNDKPAQPVDHRQPGAGGVGMRETLSTSRFQRSPSLGSTASSLDRMNGFL